VRQGARRKVRTWTRTCRSPWSVRCVKVQEISDKGREKSNHQSMLLRKEEDRRSCARGAKDLAENKKSQMDRTASPSCSLSAPKEVHRVSKPGTKTWMAAFRREAGKSLRTRKTKEGYAFETLSNKRVKRRERKKHWKQRKSSVFEYERRSNWNHLQA